MNETIQTMLKLNEGSNINAQQISLFGAYYEGLPARLALMRQLEQGEREVLQGTLGYLQGRYPLEGPDDLLSQVEALLSFQYRAVANALLQDDLKQLARSAAFADALASQLGLPQGYQEAAVAKLQYFAARLLETDWPIAEPFFTALDPDRIADWQALEQALPALIHAFCASWPEPLQKLGPAYQLEFGFRSLIAAAGLARLVNHSRPLEQAGAVVLGSWATAKLDADSLQTAWSALPELASTILPAQALAGLRPWLERLSFDLSTKELHHA
ncbi:MAG: hypothetical protein CVV27_06260 [Candidatus Melainabacteria bacterium HGW-Melainabacteria-1]|nr:MAG: hypothetical protein CVV27_06260 [Candidatus Melainabacteria bacterium HGW-Melainabacteria-1]